MKITTDEIRRKQPREFWEYARVTLEPGDTIYSNTDHLPRRIGRYEAGTYPAQRAVQKNGKPLGPYLFDLKISPYYLYYIRTDQCPTT